MQERNILHEALGLRPLSARSVVASVLLGSHPPRLSAAGLVELCGRFGISGGATRVALSRLGAAGGAAARGGHHPPGGGAVPAPPRAPGARPTPPAPARTGGGGGAGAGGAQGA